MMILAPDKLSSEQPDKVSFGQNTNSSDRRGNEARQQSNNLAYGRERLRITSPLTDTDHARNLPELEYALRNLHAGRLKADITNSSSGTTLMRNSNLIAERVLHFTSKQ
jgi:hypothetical protein